MSNFLYRLGRGAVRRRRLVLAAWILTLVLVSVLGSSLGGATVDNFQVPGTESQAGHDLLTEKFGDDTGSRAQVVIQAPEGAKVTDPSVTEPLDSFFATVAKQPHVVDVGDVTASPTDRGSARVRHLRQRPR